MSLPRYPEYRDSGVAWLGEIPAHWPVQSLKRVATLRSGESITAEQIDVDGEYPVYGAMDSADSPTDSLMKVGMRSLGAKVRSAVMLITQAGSSGLPNTR